MVISTSSDSASARKPTWPRLTPSSGVPHSRASSAARRIVPSPPMTSDQLAVDAGLGGRLDDLDVVEVQRAARRPRPRAAAARCRARAATGRTVGCDVAGVLAPGVRDHQHTAVRPGCSRGRSRPHPLTGGPQVRGATYLRARSRSSSTVAGACAQPEEELDVARTGPGSGLVVTAWAPQPRRAAAAATPATAVGAQVEVAHDAALADPAPCPPRTAA